MSFLQVRHNAQILTYQRASAPDEILIWRKQIQKEIHTIFLNRPPAPHRISDCFQQRKKK